MAIHKRTQTPKFYSNYRGYKSYLRLEFLFCCVYCGASEPEVGGQNRMHIDHYRPKDKFPRLLSIYKNLFYACPECNQSKSNYWPTKLQRLARQFVLNVCDYDIEKHIDKTMPNWVGLSYVGKWNIDFLKLSSPAQVLRRQDRIEKEELISEKRIQLENSKKALIAARNLKDYASQTELQHQIVKIERQISTLLRTIQGQP